MLFKKELLNITLCINKHVAGFIGEHFSWH